jgi:type I restriction enzyme, S subunit
LPPGWTLAKLRDVVFARKGKKPKNLYLTDAPGRLPYILIDQMEGKSACQFSDETNLTIASKEDVLVVWDGSIGKCTSGIEGVLGSTIVALKPLNVDTSFLEAFIKYSSPIIAQTSRGTGLQHINQEIFWDLELPLPPLSEQRRIGSKLKALLKNVESCQKRLEKIPVLLKRFRQAMITEAFSGRLTVDWRDENLDDGGESNNLPTLPQTWRWDRLENVCSIIVDCPHSTPKWAGEGRLCIRTTNFKPGFLDLGEKQFVSDATFTERISRLRPKQGDVLYSREGGILGVACMIPPNVELCLGQRMMLFRLDEGYLNTLFMHWLNSSFILQLVREQTGGSASPHLNVQDIKGFPIPVPPIAEQDEIIRRLEVIFTLADQIEVRYQKAMIYIDKLNQAILKRAFCGKLVLQDPNDEPASVLLERIRMERANHENKKGNKRTRKQA